LKWLLAIFGFNVNVENSIGRKDPPTIAALFRIEFLNANPFLKD